MKDLLYITRDQLWAKPRPIFEPGGGVPSGLLDVCTMFARSCKRGIRLNSNSLIHAACVAKFRTFVYYISKPTSPMFKLPGERECRGERLNPRLFFTPPLTHCQLYNRYVYTISITILVQLRQSKNLTLARFSQFQH